MKTIREILDTFQPPLYRMFVGRFFNEQAQPPDDTALLILSFAELLPSLSALTEEHYVSLLQLFVDNVEKLQGGPVLFVLVENTHVMLPGLLPIELKTMAFVKEKLPPWIRTETYNLTQLCYANKFRRWRLKNEPDAGRID